MLKISPTEISINALSNWCFCNGFSYELSFDCKKAKNSIEKNSNLKNYYYLRVTNDEKPEITFVASGEIPEVALENIMEKYEKYRAENEKQKIQIDYSTLLD